MYTLPYLFTCALKKRKEKSNPFSALNALCPKIRNTIRAWA